MPRLYRIDTKNRITLPKEALDLLHASQGDYVVVELNGEEVKIKKINY